MPQGHSAGQDRAGIPTCGLSMKSPGASVPVGLGLVGEPASQNKGHPGAQTGPARLPEETHSEMTVMYVLTAKTSRFGTPWGVKHNW